MPSLIALVEGEGEVASVPLLLRKLLYEQGIYDWAIPSPMRVGSLGALMKKLPQVLDVATGKVACGAVLILLDLDDGCPMVKARELAADVRRLAVPIPVAVVFAHCEYEAWFLASLSTIAGNHGIPAGTTYPGLVEERRGAKEWITGVMPSGVVYKQTRDQARMTQLLEPAAARLESRSFRRLEHAVQELLQAAGAGVRGVATP